MRLFIAEKPSVAKALAAELNVTGSGDGYIECGNDSITWCFGHMLEQASPDEYTADDIPRTPKGAKVWRAEDLPIIPDKWILHPKADAAKQLKVISKLLKAADEVVNAGDPDREGQLLVDAVLEHFHYCRRVSRFWVSAQDSVSLKRGLATLKDNEEFKGFGAAAQARGCADWLIGMNLSRAYTLRAARAGSRVLLTVGRVQTPTLSIVVARDRQIESFKSIPFYGVRASLSHTNGSFTCDWKPTDDQAGLDSEGRVIDPLAADAVMGAVRGKPGVVKAYTQEPKRKPHPRAYSLSDITLAASNKYGYTAAEVLEGCQALYETHKLASYPRTDTGYLPESQHADARRVLDAIKHVDPTLAELVDHADVSIKSATWNDAKVTAHHGIIPTMHRGSKAALSVIEQRLHALIVRAYIAQFYPVHEFLSTTVDVTIGDHAFRATGRVVTKNGWRDVFSADEDRKPSDEVDQALPAMRTGDALTCDSAERIDSRTKPPARFTEGTLGQAMEDIHKFVATPEHRKLLREGDGIGTPATRATIIAELKRRQFLETKGKHIVSTVLGRSLVDALPEVIKSPVLTALHERVLKGIEQGTSDPQAFLEKQAAFIRDQVAKAGVGSIAIAGGKEAPIVSTVHKCKACNSGLSKRAGKRGNWWGCSRFPTCKQTYPDLKGRPDFSKAPKA